MYGGMWNVNLMNGNVGTKSLLPMMVCPQIVSDNRGGVAAEILVFGLLFRESVEPHSQFATSFTAC